MRDYFIIGQGVAGSVMAMQLLQKGKSIQVFESPRENTSSSVAAGIMNPITGKRLAVSWLAREMFPVAYRFYRRAEEILEDSFCLELPVMRILNSIAQQNDWVSRLSEERFRPFVDQTSMMSMQSNAYHNPFDALKVAGGGRVDVAKFIGKVKEYLSSQNVLTSLEVKSDMIKAIPDGFEIEGFTAKKIIFCTGWDQDLWDFLPFTPMKGEVLEVKGDGLATDKIVVGGCFMSPKGNGAYYLGATYDWRNVNLVPTEAGKEELLNRAEKFVVSKLEVVDHKVGIRPAVKDRRPLLGEHPLHKDMYLFSGLGSKGVSMAPYLAEMLVDHIEKGKALHPEADLNRFV